MATLKKDGTITHKGKTIGVWGYKYALGLEDLFGTFAAKFTLMGKEVTKGAATQKDLRELVKWLLSDEYADSLKK